jgi:hypothetical protein
MDFENQIEMDDKHSDAHTRSNQQTRNGREKNRSTISQGSSEKISH